MNRATQLANKVLDRFNYAICCFYPGPKPLPEIGDVLNVPISGGRLGLGHVPGPFRIIGTATRAEYVEQRRFLGFADWHREPLAYFKVIAE